MTAVERPVRQEAQPAREDVEELGPGLLRLQLPLRMPGLGHVNCYVLEGRDGVTLVDPGMPGPQPWKALEGRLRGAGIPMRAVRHVVVTHSHIDHFGASGRIRVVAGAAVVTHRTFRTWWDPTDVGEGVELEPMPKGRPWERPTPWGGEHPRPPLRVRIRFRVMKPLMRRWFRTPSPSRRLDEAEVVRLGDRDWVAVHTPGHTPDHLCLFDPDAGVLLSGDHVLPTITPHISGLDAGPDPLTSYFSSLERMHDLAGVRLVLPAHGHPFADLDQRVKDIRRHHEERLATLRDAAGELGEATVEALSQRLFRPRSWGPMAESETYAHLEHLRLSGQADRREEAGRLYYRLS